MGIRFIRPSPAFLTAAILGIALAFVGLVAETMTDARHEAWARAAQAGTNLDRAVVEEMERTISSLDLSLQAVVDGMQNPDVLKLDAQMRDRVLFDRSATAKHLSTILVMDAEGHVSVDARTGKPRTGSYADREYFQAQRDNPQAGMFVSAPYRGRETPEWLFAVSRRLAAPPGTSPGFAGIVVGTIRLEPIRAFLSSLDLGPHGTIIILRDDGAVMMRVPFREGLLGSNVRGGNVFERARLAPDGQLVAASSIDGVQRLHTFGRVPETHLMVIVSLAVEDIEAGWWRHALRVWLGTGVLVVALTTTALLLQRALRRRQEAEAAARESETSFRLLAENSGDMVTRLGFDGVRRYVSPACRRIFGRAPEELVGHRPQEHVHPNDVDAVLDAMQRLRAGTAEEENVVYRVRHADGTWLWIETTARVVLHPETGLYDGMVAVSRDITERKNMEAELARLASLDALTGIANRRTFDARIENEWRRCARSEGPLSLLLIDIDRFKALNDHYGHQHGDECLRRVGAVIGQTVRRASDISARYGGEEFAILLPETNAAGAAAVAERVRQEVEALALPHAGYGVPEAVVTVSIGVATLFPDGAVMPPCTCRLVELADRALYEAKRAGRNRVVRAEPAETDGDAIAGQAAATRSSSSATQSARTTAGTGLRSSAKLTPCPPSSASSAAPVA